jgi:hypothetical protein
MNVNDSAEALIQLIEQFIKKHNLTQSTNID